MYRVKFTQAALDSLARLDKPVGQQMLNKLHWLAENFEGATHQPLTGNLKGIFKLRVGDYRALYTFDSKEEVIFVHFVQHRSEVYKTK